MARVVHESLHQLHHPAQLFDRSDFLGVRPSHCHAIVLRLHLQGRFQQGIFRYQVTAHWSEEFQVPCFNSIQRQRLRSGRRRQLRNCYKHQEKQLQTIGCIERAN